MTCEGGIFHAHFKGVFILLLLGGAFVGVCRVCVVGAVVQGLPALAQQPPSSVLVGRGRPAPCTPFGLHPQLPRPVMSGLIFPPALSCICDFYLCFMAGTF